MNTPAHSHLGASSADRWMSCPASVKASEGIPDNGSVFAAEGTAAHHLAELVLARFKGMRNVLADPDAAAADYVGNFIHVFEHAGKKLVGMTPDEEPPITFPLAPEPRTFEVTEEMADHVQVYLNYLRIFTHSEDPACVEWDYEIRFSLTHLHPGMFGTGDFRAVAHGLLTIVDLKYGKGVVVGAIDNAQLLYYALGAYEALPAEQKRKVKRIRMAIVQPRTADPVRSWEIDLEDLLLWSNDLIMLAQSTESPNAPFKAGDHCMFCRAKPICETARREALRIAQADFMAEPGTIPDVQEAASMTPETLAKILSEADYLEGWINSVRQYAHERAVAGVEVPGMKLVAKRPMRRWKDPEGAETELAGLIDPWVKKLVSPAQAEKLLGSKRKNLIDGLWHSISSGTVLVPLSDKREPVKAAAADDFAVLLAED